MVLLGARALEGLNLRVDLGRKGILNAHGAIRCIREIRVALASFDAISPASDLPASRFAFDNSMRRDGNR